MAGRGGPSLGQGRGKGTDYSINKDVTPFWEHAGLEGALHCPFPKDTWLPYSLEQVEGGCELPNAGQDLWAGVISTLLGQMPQDKHQPVSPAPPPPIPSLHPRNRPGQQQDQWLLLAGGGLVVEEVPGPDVLGGEEGAAEGKRRDVP